MSFFSQDVKALFSHGRASIYLFIYVFLVSIERVLSSPSLLLPVQITPDSSIYETGRYMFVFNTKLCQSEKAAQVAARKWRDAALSPPC